MEILKHNKWNKLLSSISAHRLFLQNISSSHQEMALLGSTMLARQIALRCPELIGREGVRICIAGCENFDGNADLYRALPLLLGLKDWEVVIDMVGNNIHLMGGESDVKLKPDIGKGVTVRRFDMFLGEYIKEYGTPDVVLINCPGFEEYGNLWFGDGGLSSCVNADVKILGSSYGEDEAEADQVFAKAHGYVVSGIQNNPLYFTQAYKETNSHMSSWGYQVWEIKEANFEIDEELLSLCNKKAEITTEFLRATGKTPFEMFDLSTKNPKGELCYWVYGPLFFNSSTFQIIEDGSGEVIVDDVELDATYLSEDRSTFTQALLISAVIRRDYLDELI